jgi:hypothetical protein
LERHNAIAALQRNLSPQKRHKRNGDNKYFSPQIDADERRLIFVDGFFMYKGHLRASPCIASFLPLFFSESHPLREKRQPKPGKHSTGFPFADDLRADTKTDVHYFRGTSHGIPHPYTHGAFFVACRKRIKLSRK